MKKHRQDAIMKIIASSDIETQNQLMGELAKIGVHSAQATISRDIKALHLIKEPTPGGVYRYVRGSGPDDMSKKLRLKAILRESVASCLCAQNIVVLKTLPGLAPAACSAIDSMGIEAHAGSVGGGDTAFLAMTDNDSANEFCMEIEEMLK